MTTLEQITKLEGELLEAMLKSDVEKLDMLISDELVFAAHTGDIFSKSADIEAHRLGNIRIERLEASEQVIKIYDTTAIVFVLLKIKGSFFGQISEGTFRFSRVWMKLDENWKIVSGHSTLINE